MIFIESPAFTEDVRRLLTDESYADLQLHFYALAAAQIRMVLIYKKGVKDDLTPKEKTILRKLNEEWHR